MNEDTPRIIQFLLDRSKDGKEFYINNKRYYFSVGGILMESTEEVIKVDCFGQMIDKFKTNICQLNIYELCNPNNQYTLEPTSLNLQEFVSLHKEMN